MQIVISYAAALFVYMQNWNLQLIYPKLVVQVDKLQ